MRIHIPRNRDASFELVLILKHERRLTGFDDKIVAMYARRMTVREIQGFLAKQYGTGVPPQFISDVTDAVMTEVVAWQTRALDPIYPVVFFDALRVKIREDAVVRTKACTLPEALATVYLATTLQNCLVHLMRASLDYASWTDRCVVAAAIKPI